MSCITNALIIWRPPYFFDLLAALYSASTFFCSALTLRGESVLEQTALGNLSPSLFLLSIAAFRAIGSK